MSEHRYDLEVLMYKVMAHMAQLRRFYKRFGFVSNIGRGASA